MMTQSILFWTAVSLYALATILFFMWVAFRKEWCGAWGRRAAVFGLIPHGVSLVLRWVEIGHGPYSSRYEVLSSNTFVMVTIYFLASRFVKGIRGLGVFVMPAAFLLMGWSVSTFGVKADVPIILKSYWLLLHVTFAKAFAACTIMAAGAAIAFLIKYRNPASLPSFPVKEKLELYAYQFLLISFLFLGVMIVAGSLWAHQSWGRYWAWDPIETTSLTTWITFGIILHFRVLHRWSGKPMAYLTLVAFGFALATLYIVTLLVPTIHNAYLVGK